MHSHDRSRLRADGALVVRQSSLVGRADFTEPGPGDLEDLGEPKTAADLDQLAARDDHFAAARQRPQASTVAPALLFTAVAAAAPVNSRSKPSIPPVRLPAPAILEVELEIAIASRRLRDGRDRLFRQRSTPQTRMQQDRRSR